MSKNLIFGENVNVQLRIESFNVFNHTNFQLPNNVFGTGPYPGTPSTPFFAQPTAAADPRRIQLGLKVTF